MRAERERAIVRELDAVWVELKAISDATPSERATQLMGAVVRTRAWLIEANAEPIPLLLWCPECGTRHICQGEFATEPHRSHACQSCGMVWRPAVEATVGVGHLPGFKNEESR